MNTKTDIIVRAATISDASLLTEFNQRLAAETEDLILTPETVAAGVRRMLEVPVRGFYRVAEWDGKVVACLGVTFEWSDWRNGVFWWIQSVYVLPEYRRRGVFRTLYSAVLEEARSDSDVCGCRLYVEKENPTAQATYEGLGMISHYLVYETSASDFLKD